MANEKKAKEKSEAQSKEAVNATESKENKLSLRGRTFEGKVISDKMHKTVTVEWERKRFVPKYERYEKRRTRIKAHNPENINAKLGDTVKIMETRPISKTKNFIVVEVKKDQGKKE